METPVRFIVVDDDPTNNFICKVSLNNFFGKSTDVLLFEEPEIALAYIKKEYERSNVKTALFLDINMPGMTGWDFLDQFENFSEEIKQQFVIYILSSSVDQRDKDKAGANVHATGFLSKPLLDTTLSQLFSQN